jgi:Holliday junction resolvasome RuvABC endonuclease subunit
MRSFHAVRLDQGEHSVFSVVIKARKNEERSKILRALSTELATIVDGSDPIYIEEPPLAGVRNLRTFKGLAETAGALMARSSGKVTYVPVSSWKKEVCGKGNLDKAGVADWLLSVHRSYSEHCAGDQNLIDATCIALYGAIQEWQAAVDSAASTSDG